MTEQPKMMCEDDGVEMVEFHDVTGKGWHCPSSACDWVVMEQELEQPADAS
ncbi:hypothetical protein ACH427_04525 [Streptomyces sp. NPDC020379]|uniref:hypothetical protein n=1 Tax=Streptomyces sp. NPDC020379 TaxID=3365071 RepID=UPI00379ADACD